MNVADAVSNFAGLLADKARSRMVFALMDGRPLTAGELARTAGVSPPTASSHLARLDKGGLVKVEIRGRNRYYAIRDDTAAHAIEALMVAAQPAPRTAPKPRAVEKPLQPIQLARMCYDHLAGRLGVLLTEHLIADGVLRRGKTDFVLTPKGAAFLEQWGIPVAPLRKQRRAFARQCLDWTERRPHLGGAVGAALAHRALELGWIKRNRHERSLSITVRGSKALRERFGITPQRLEQG